MSTRRIIPPPPPPPPPGRKPKAEEILAAAVRSARVPKFEIRKDRQGRWFWRLIAANGKGIATAGEYFDSKANAKRAAERVRAVAGTAAVIVYD